MLDVAITGIGCWGQTLTAWMWKSSKLKIVAAMERKLGIAEV